MADIKNQEDLKVAFCGTRGLPANYGGFETAVDEITSYFVEQGVKCDVFNRKSTSGKVIDNYNGIEIITVKGSKVNQLDTFLSSIQTGIYLLKNRKKYKYILWFNNANFPGILLTKLTGIPMAVNTDGLEWRRSKWSKPFKLYYYISTYFITKIVKNLISDSISIKQYYKENFKKDTIFIPYGANNKVKSNNSLNEEIEKDILDKYEIEKDKFFLQITRFEPENSPLMVVEGFKKSGLGKLGYKLVIVGYKEQMSIYADKVKKNSGDNGVIILDAIYDKVILNVLRSSCYSYVHGNTVGGTNPALLEAMLDCKRILAIDNGFSREVLGELGYFFNENNIHESFKEIIKKDNQKAKLEERVTNVYKWSDVSESYLNLVLNKNGMYPINPLEYDNSVGEQNT
ncbi:hypothetical protein SAFG77S_07345 [Streptomyces afghaniensis]